MRNHFLKTVGLSILLILLLPTVILAAETNNINRWNYIPTSDELVKVYQIVWLEAGNQGNKGQQAVAEIILNRVLSDKFPNTIDEVLSQKGQFTCVSKLDTAKVTDKVIENVNKVFEGKSDVLSTKAFYFQNYPKGTPCEVQIGDHYFRREFK